ncbi:hypothetical protein [Foetidibacter luteolus]|uniref:hypothetical protein n=1 Tax=Foetidibacter luteolus TaxID=2608880 RepID=UPI00129A82FD|nr:hypothetical protein [Foetidibacter luteolus]
MKSSYIPFYTCLLLLFSCAPKKPVKEESIPISEIEAPGQADSSKGLATSKSFTQINTAPNTVILTGMNNIRLFSVYKTGSRQDNNLAYDEGTSYYDNGENDNQEGNYKYFMPGIDIIPGYNLLNIGHYQVDKDSLSYFFEKPVLIKTLYFPGVKKDSLDKKEVSRDFFLVSVYNADTNNDSLISNKDLRRFFFIDALNRTRISLLPEGYSAVRSSYDYKNDMMFIYTRQDANNNGTAERTEPVHIFLLNFKNPAVLKRLM